MVMIAVLSSPAAMACLVLFSLGRQIRTRSLFPKSDGYDLRTDELVWKSTLALSGSRGIGGVVSSISGSVDLFDLEEDEDEES
mmetsp:Transcript_29588/g.87691  ORF Transcript_29588/g.87691 Transcript_29588/m.87691 type:complete len:83 (+) Transcript_29588:2861-3109(+)